MKNMRANGAHLLMKESKSLLDSATITEFSSLYDASQSLFAPYLHENIVIWTFCVSCFWGCHPTALMAVNSSANCSKRESWATSSTVGDERLAL
jgi:hypothetical protein